jgi:hypothetical protein
LERKQKVLYDFFGQKWFSAEGSKNRQGSCLCGGSAMINKHTAYKIVKAIQDDMLGRKGMAEDIDPDVWTEIMDEWVGLANQIIETDKSSN